MARAGSEAARKGSEMPLRLGRTSPGGPHAHKDESMTNQRRIDDEPAIIAVRIYK